MSVTRKAAVASVALLGLMALTWFTIGPGHVRLVALVILGFFLFRVLIHTARATREERDTMDEDDE